MFGDAAPGFRACESTQTYRVERLSAADAGACLDGLVALLRDVVDGGASVGFLPPLDPAAAAEYWVAAIRAVAAGTRVLLAAVEDGAVLGSVQADLAPMPNARHRAEVMKLMVHSVARRRGIGGALMRAIEDAARAMGRTLLVLDTRRGDAAERLYERLGYVRAGVIPRYARGAAGSLDDTVLFYRELWDGVANVRQE